MCKGGGERREKEGKGGGRKRREERGRRRGKREKERGGREEEGVHYKRVTCSTAAWCKCCCTSVLRLVMSISCALICACTSAGREVPAKLAKSTFNLHRRHTHSHKQFL